MDDATPRPPLLLGKTRYPLYRRLDGPQGLSCRVQKNSTPPIPGFDPRNDQPVASRYTDWTDLAVFMIILKVMFNTGVLISPCPDQEGNKRRSISGDARNFNNIETLAVIRFFLFLQGKLPNEIHAILVRLRTYQHPCTYVVNWHWVGWDRVILWTWLMGFRFS